MTIRPRLLGCVLAAAVSLGAAPAAARPNATITNGNVHLRQSYPTFGASTLFRFRLSPGVSLAIIAEGTRVTAMARKVVAKSEWFLVEYTTSGGRLNGWVYAGEVGRRRYVALDRGVEAQLRTAAAFPSGGVPLIRTLAVGTVVYAQEETVTEPDIPTKVLPTLAIGLAHVAIFIVAMVAIKRWVFPTSDTCTLATSVFVLLALHVITQDGAADLLSKFALGR